MNGKPSRGGRPQGTGSQAERVLRLLVDLDARAWSLDDLAAKHGVTTRTVRRDLAVVGRVYRLARTETPGGGATFALEAG